MRSFIGPTGGDAQNPGSPLVEGSDGALYGATVDNGYPGVVAPIVFKINKDGNAYRVLHTFGAYSGAGELPAAALTAGRDGVLYGTASLTSQVVFKMNQDGSGYAVLHTFGSAPDGQQPIAALIEATDGVLYGTTASGGSSGYGTVYKLNKNGSGYTILRNFTSIDGVSPSNRLLEGSDGVLYGTTASGGLSYPDNVGTVFKLNKDGSGFGALHYFTSSSGEGRGPRAALVQGSDGALYGTTDSGGTNDHGTIFKLNRDGNGYRILFNFVSTGQFLSNPRIALLKANGKLYGTGQGGYDYGGAYYPGTVFTINEDGTGYTILRTFSNSDTCGWFLPAPLMQSVDGTFYGITQYGGELNFGIVFRLWPAETPDMLGVSASGADAQVRFAGAGNSHYQILRSIDLSNWSALTTITMPGSGIYTHLDPAPPNPAFYRVAWVP